MALVGGSRLGCARFGRGAGRRARLLKIDIEFVRDLTTSSASRNVVRGIVNLARGFGLKTIAEGVEDQSTLAMLPELGVDYAQGFHIGRPGPLRALATHHEASERRKQQSRALTRAGTRRVGSRPQRVVPMFIEV